jgi:hypothetical protein
MVRCLEVNYKNVTHQIGFFVDDKTSMCIQEVTDAHGHATMSVGLSFRRDGEPNSKRIGKKYALKRAMAPMDLDKLERTAVWKQFNERYPIKKKRRK